MTSTASTAETATLRVQGMPWQHVMAQAAAFFHLAFFTLGFLVLHLPDHGLPGVLSVVCAFFFAVIFPQERATRALSLRGDTLTIEGITDKLTSPRDAVHTIQIDARTLHLRDPEGNRFHFEVEDGSNPTFVRLVQVLLGQAGMSPYRSGGLSRRPPEAALPWSLVWRCSLRRARWCAQVYLLGALAAFTSMAGTRGITRSLVSTAIVAAASFWLSVAGERWRVRSR